MNILSIGGSDTSSGAGIQSDIKIFSNNGFYPFTVITAITSQNTKKITSIEPVSRRSLELQMESVLSDSICNSKLRLETGSIEVIFFVF